jgi:hypothetical protein
MSTDPKFAGSNQTEDNGFLMAIKIRSTAFFVGEGKEVASCRKILRHVKYPCWVWQKYLAGKVNECYSPIVSPFRYYVSLLKYARDIWWLNQELFELRWGRTRDMKMAVVHGTLFVIPPRNSDQYISACEDICEGRHD